MSGARRWSALLVAGLCVLAACRRGGEPAGAGGGAAGASAPVRPAASEPGGGEVPSRPAATDQPAAGGRRPAATPAPIADENAVEDLVQEEREADPRSEKVKISIIVEPVRAKVFWGIKCLGSTPLELERPRQSGPMDLVIEAPGYVRYHTRVFTDRDDKLTVHMVSAGAGGHVLGYRPPEEKTAEKASAGRKK